MTTLRETADALARSDHGVFFVSRTATHLGGVDRWLGGFSYVLYSDGWDGAHPRVFTPKNKPRATVRGTTRVVNWLLANREVQRHIASTTPAGQRPRIVAAFFDETTELLCDKLDYELIMPKNALRTRVDSKIETTRLGDAAGVPSVPNVLGRADSWAEVRSLADAAGLGEHLVVQTPYGNSGQTTYFMSSEADFARVADEVRGEDLKIMRRIEHLPITVDGVITRDGTVSGPLLAEITGHPELTRYRGGWTGNVLSEAEFSGDLQREGAAAVQRFATALAAEGYRGVFCVDLLLDTDDGSLYLGELNPRLSGASPASNLAVSHATGLPLFAYHLLEFCGAAAIPIDEARSRVAETERETWSHTLVQHLGGDRRIVGAPRTGRYRIDSSGALEFVSADRDWYEIERADEVFFLRLAEMGDVCETGQDLGMIVTRTRLQSSDRELTGEAKQLITAVQDLFELEPLGAARRAAHRMARVQGGVAARLRDRLAR